MKQAVAVIRLAKSKGLTIGAVESMTGGLLAAALTSVSGASAVFKGGLITYANEEKERLLGIPNGKLKKDGAISDAVAQDMAKLARYRLNVDIAVAVTGNAGPKAIEGKPIGQFYVALCTGNECEAELHEFHGTRRAVRQNAVAVALTMIEKTIGNMR